ncbi:hypothetical protein [Pseudooceanicola nanhaiensis]|jgi:hypothetical protein|uniref:1,4-alpha-glucan branching enzyme n=1 Tax=Pseudooceanicola nanhaiensis TaxID=375761 RepID=A0A917SV43_9RHOB|nr:hypothetical protein [Pseudooceanicola nanhaiensis]GGL99062.1 hypothetical protein GCM10011534_21170 [Pseudooceanicola nanhaiensis]
MSDAKTTTDHKAIQKWAEDRGGKPARVADTRGEGGVLRIDFGRDEEGLEILSWEDFFEIFESDKLAFLHQDKTADGETSRFNKFVDR